jgi:glycine reductase complex component B subunit gamma
MIRIAHYINQFFGQIGGEEQAGVPPKGAEGPVGPGILIERLARDRARVVATLICGDNYFSEHTEEALEAMLSMLRGYSPDILIAGPAFNAGRYGIACGAVCRRVQEELGIPCVTGMYPENPGVDLYRRGIYIVEAGNNAAAMGKAMPRMIDLAFKLYNREEVGTPSEEGYIPRGVKRNVLSEKLAAERAVELLLKKMKGEPFQTEVPLPTLDAVRPAEPVADLSRAVIAVVTEGGLVPKANPDDIESARATRYGKYPVKELETQGSTGFESIHRGFDTTSINEDPNRLVPVDVLRELEQEGVFKSLFPFYYVTTGVATTMANAKNIGRGIGDELRAAKVSGVILTST